VKNCWRYREGEEQKTERGGGLGEIKYRFERKQKRKRKKIESKRKEAQKRRESRKTEDRQRRR